MRKKFGQQTNFEKKKKNDDLPHAPLWKKKLMRTTIIFFYCLRIDSRKKAKTRAAFMVLSAAANDTEIKSQHLNHRFPIIAASS